MNPQSAPEDPPPPPRAKRLTSRRSPTAGNRGQGGKWLHPTTRLRIYARDGWRCVWCTCEVERSTQPEDGILVRGDIIRQASIDHVVPRSRGGSNTASNLITCCAHCNPRRGDRSVFGFAALLFSTREQIRACVLRVRAAQRRKLPVLAEGGQRR